MVGTVNVSGVAPVINLSITPPSVNSGSVNVGQFSDQTFTITNQPASNATLTGNVGTLAAPFSVQTGGGVFSLTPGQSATVTVRFSPTVPGTASGNLSISHNATNQTSPSIVSLSGTGGDTPLIDFDGDGKTDIAIWDPSNGVWFIIRSSDGIITYTQWGGGTDIPVSQ